jgi:hypothetical protein
MVELFKSANTTGSVTQKGQHHLIEIPLHNGMVALVWNRDARLIQRHWTALEGEYTWYAVSGRTLLHREIMRPGPLLEVDHRNGDGLDNRRSNLRLATRSQNAMNRRLQANNTSGVAGVTWMPKRGKWRATVKVQGHRIELGFFSTFERAVEAREAAVIKHYGEFRR